MTTTDPGGATGEPTPRAFTRRRFLLGASAVGAASFIGFRAWPDDDEDDLPGLQVARSATTPKPEVGYVERSDDLDDLSIVPYGVNPVSPAEALPNGDRSFVGGLVKATILGLTPGFVDGAHAIVRGVALDALMPHPDRDVTEPLPYFAWTLSSAPLRTSNSTTYTVAMGKRPRLGFTLDVAQHDGARFTSTSTFTAGRDDGSARLRRGIYLLGLRPGSWSRRQALPTEDSSAWVDQVSVAVAIDHA